MEAITGAVQSGFNTLAEQALDMIGTVFPYAIAVMGGVLVVTLGVKVFKRITGR